MTSISRPIWGPILVGLGAILMADSATAFQAQRSAPSAALVERARGKLNAMSSAKDLTLYKQDLKPGQGLGNPFKRIQELIKMAYPEGNYPKTIAPLVNVDPYLFLSQETDGKFRPGTMTLDTANGRLAFIENVGPREGQEIVLYQVPVAAKPGEFRIDSFVQTQEEPENQISEETNSKHVLTQAAHLNPTKTLEKFKPQIQVLLRDNPDLQNSDNLTRFMSLDRNGFYALALRLGYDNKRFNAGDELKLNVDPQTARVYLEHYDSRGRSRYDPVELIIPKPKPKAAAKKAEPLIRTRTVDDSHVKPDEIAFWVSAGHHAGSPGAARDHKIADVFPDGLSAEKKAELERYGHEFPEDGVIKVTENGINLMVSQKLQAKLKSMGYHAFLTRGLKNEAITNPAKFEMIKNGRGQKFAIDIQANGNGGGLSNSAQGFELFYHGMDNLGLAVEIREALVHAGFGRNGQIKPRIPSVKPDTQTRHGSIGFCRQGGCESAVLLETIFISSPSDVRNFLNNDDLQNRYINAVAEAMVNHAKETTAAKEQSN